MYRYAVWPGAYSFKNEVGLFLEYFKDRLQCLIKQIEETEKAIVE